ncbi:adhesion G-protein coupled receptor G4 isoform X1 [Gadus morhua]|uniref:adhesion G-protein coupled receptor G4 isoform X1 n=2 Tax=Gadus morhua TaxID=8049 RepID=UPI0011B78185|nr:adhesion G-protein coupled receptor G4-like isoform X1 [Gadus morhua]
MARSPPIIMLWLWLQSSMYLQGSNIHGNPSLWGKKAEFQIKPCMWQLEPGLSVPELEELSVCVLLRLTVITEWTAFAYKAPGNPAVELGLEGDDQHITAVLFGARWPLNESLSSKVWQSVCLTWSAASRHLRLYVNGTRRLDQAVDPPVSGRLAPNGTLTLAWPHSVDQNGTVWREDGKTLMGGIGLFRMWAREWRAEEIMLLGCVEGDVVSWDARHWNHRSPASCPPKEDTSLHCEWSSYEIKMWAYIKHSNTSDATNSSLESITRHWMESIFPQNFSVQHVSVLSQSRRCLAGDNPAALYIQLPKKSKEFGNFTFDYCFLSEVLVSISPKKSVELVQADIRMKLEPEFSYDSLTLRTDIHDLSIQPVAPLYTMTEPPPIVSESPRPATDKTFSFPTMSTDSTTEGPKSCPEETLESIYGVYLWPETFTFGPQFMKCQRPFYGVAFRVCKFDIDSDMTSWEDPDMTYCEPHMNISDLHDWNVTAENAMDMVQTIQRLLFYELVYGSGSDAELSASDMVTVMGKLDDVVDVSVVTAELSNDIFLIISLILIPRRDMAPVSNMVLKLTERIGDKAVFSGDLFNVAFPKMAVSMINVQPKNFRGITFCVTNYADGMIPELMVNESFAEPIPGTVASITLPAELKNRLAADGNKTRIQFQFYGVQDLFNDTDIAIEAEGNWTLNSYVISASINNRTVKNLNQSVEVTLSNNRAMQEHEKVMCVFWDFGDNEGQGGWNSQGCETRPISAIKTSCFCNHLTNFAVLLDISRAPLTTNSTQQCPSSPTTTKAPLNNTVGIMVSFFGVNMTFILNGNATNPTTVIECWLYERLVLNGMDMVDFWIFGNSIRNMKQYGVQQISHGLNEEYNCTFHVRGNLLSTIKELETLIVGSLNQTFSNDTLSIQTTQLMVRYIGPSCPEETLKTIYGVYLWPETFPLNKRALKCQRDFNRTAFRFCKFDVDSDMTSWEVPDMTECEPLTIISDLNDHNVTAENAMDMVQTIQDLVDVELGSGSGDGELSASDMVTVVGKLDDVVDVSVVTAELSNDIFSMISDILISRSDMAPVSNMVLKLTERIGDKAVFSGDLFNVAFPAMAVSMINVKPKNFSGITFCVTNYADGMTPELMVNESFAEPIPGTVASIALPAELKNQLAADGNKTRFQFQFYGVQDLFNDTGIAIKAEGNWTLNSYVISASINNRTVKNLNQSVEVTLSNNRAMQEHENVTCVFWDFGDNEAQGRWNSTGCETRAISANVTSCSCNHLTSFAVLLDISRAPMSEKDREIMTLISYLGCGISSIFLGITLMTYLIFGKLRRDHPSKILINLSAALLALNLLYLLNTWMSSYGYGLCILTAVLMHFFLLASFTWMGLEALHMYFALIKVFNAYVRSYILKLCVVGWGVPLIIVGVVLATDVDAYGSSNITSAADETSEPFCWIQSDVHFYVTVAGFILLVVLGNTGVFVVVLIQIRRMRTNKPLGKPAAGGSAQDLRAAASLTVLLGLTWLSAFFAVGPGRTVMLYVFCILNSLQGFFIFVFHCLTKENVRKQWRTRLTFDRFKPNDSDWSRSTSRPKQEPNSHSMGSVDTSSIIKASEFSSTTESLPVHPGSEGAGLLLQVAQPASTPNNIKTNTSVSWSNQ